MVISNVRIQACFLWVKTFFISSKAFSKDTPSLFPITQKYISFEWRQLFLPLRDLRIISSPFKQTKYKPTFLRSDWFPALVINLFLLSKPKSVEYILQIKFYGLKREEILRKFLFYRESTKFWFISFSFTRKIISFTIITTKYFIQCRIDGFNQRSCKNYNVTNIF